MESPAETVFCLLRVKPGQTDELIELCRKHDETLGRLELRTPEPSKTWSGGDGHGGHFVVQIFSWKDPDALDTARKHPDVQHVWEAMDGCCERMEFPHLAPVPD